MQDSQLPNTTATTPLHALHTELGAKLVPFAGWAMPISYEGVIAEHLWCRSSAALFDVAHMATITIRGSDPAAALETVTPAGVTTLAEHRQRYGLLTTDAGGTIDDFMVVNAAVPGELTLVVNASRRQVDLDHLRSRLDGVEVIERTDVALLALQGPEAVAVVADAGASELTDTVFLDHRSVTIDGMAISATRSGYTGEDGVELAVSAEHADALARRLLADDRVRPAGLGARDTLRLEAGLCLYGNDLDDTISPIEADLAWTIPKRRRTTADFPGADRILAELADGPSRRRVGVLPDGKRPVRPSAALLNSDGATVGTVSSGGFGPSVDRPVAMAYVRPEDATTGTALVADVRGKDVPCTIADIPFHPHRYRR